MAVLTLAKCRHVRPKRRPNIESLAPITATAYPHLFTPLDRVVVKGVPIAYAKPSLYPRLPAPACIRHQVIVQAHNFSHN